MKPSMVMMKGNKLANDFTLTRRQIEKLYQISSNFKEIEWFTLEESNSSGIGPTVLVKFKVFKEKEQDTDAIVDITDYKTW